MKAVILAAGMGTRLGSLTPKVLTSIIDERTIMDFQVERLSEAVGRDNIMVVVGYKKELIMEKFPDLMFVYNPAYAHTNTAKSLLAAVAKVDDDMLWINGDVFFEPEALKPILTSQTSGVLVDTKKCGDEEIKYTLDTRGNIEKLSKQASSGLGEAVGINLLKQADIPGFKHALGSVAAQDYFEKALENMIAAQKIILKPIMLDEAYCKEIDFPEDLAEVRSNAARLNLLNVS